MSGLNPQTGIWHHVDTPGNFKVSENASEPGTSHAAGKMWEREALRAAGLRAQSSCQPAPEGAIHRKAHTDNA